MPDGGRMFLPQGRGRGPGQRSGQGKRTGDNRLRIPRRHRSCAGKPQGRCSARLLPARLLCEDRKKTHCSVCPPKNSREQGGRNTLLRAFRLVLLLQHVPPHASGRLRGVATQTAHSLYTLRQGHKKSAVLKLNVLRKYSTRYRTEIVYRKIPLCARQKKQLFDFICKKTRRSQALSAVPGLCRLRKTGGGGAVPHPKSPERGRRSASDSQTELFPKARASGKMREALHTCLSSLESPVLAAWRLCVLPNARPAARDVPHIRGISTKGKKPLLRACAGQ